MQHLENHSDLTQFHFIISVTEKNAQMWAEVQTFGTGLHVDNIYVIRGTCGPKTINKIKVKSV